LVLGLEPRFDLDLTMAAERHRELSRALHPDRFATAGSGERRQALHKAILVNEAWRTLKDPITRAEALLQRLGVAIGEQTDPKPSQDFLMQMMEAREELSSLSHQPNEDAAFSAWQGQYQSRHGAVCTELASLFEPLLNSKTVSAAQLTPVREKLVELRYIQRLLQEARNAQDELG